MKMIKRLTTVVMILALLAVPMASFAEGLQSFSIGNIAFSGMDIEMNIGASIKASTGTKDGRNLTTLTLLGGETGTDEIGTVMVASDENGMKLALDGLSKAFSFSKEDFDQVMAKYAIQAGGEVASQFDTEALKTMVDSYMKLIASQKDKEALKKVQQENNEKLIAYFGDRYQVVGDESYEVFDMPYTGQRVKLTFTMEDMDALMNIMSESDENAKSFLDSYFKFLSSVAKQQGMESFDSLSGLYKAIGATFSCDIDAVSNDPSGEIGSGAAKFDFVFHITADGQTVDMPMQMQTLINEEGQRVCVIVDTVIDEVPMYMDIDVNETANGKSDFTYVMKAGPENEKVEVNMDIASAKSEDKENFKLTLNTVLNGQQLMTGDIAYDGTVAKTGLGKAHDGKLTIAADVAEYGKISFSTDVKYTNEPKAEVDFSAIDALPTIAFSELGDEQKMQELTSEAEVIAFKALGVLMQTPGIAEIVTSVISAAQSAAPETSEYGYEDYSADGEDFEGFEDWQEIEGLDGEIPA